MNRADAFAEVRETEPDGLDVGIVDRGVVHLVWLLVHRHAEVGALAAIYLRPECLPTGMQGPVTRLVNGESARSVCDDHPFPSPAANILVAAQGRPNLYPSGEASVEAAIEIIARLSVPARASRVAVLKLQSVHGEQRERAKVLADEIRRQRDVLS